MMSEGAKRLEIALSLSDPCDYEEFCESCLKEGIEPLPILEYAQKMGIAMVAVRRFPNDDPMDAYMRLVTSKQLPTLPVPESREAIRPPEPPPQKRCCGGGKVR